MTTETQDIIISPASALAIAPVMDLATAKKRLYEFQEFVQSYMKEGEDYGTIPGTPKPTLYKPGADKLCELYGLSDSYRILDKTEDFDKGLFDYNIECTIVSRRDGTLVSTGLGSCNSYEGKYRWRDLQRVCPVCGKSAIIKGKQEYGGGWLCFKKKDGCGYKFADGDQTIEGQAAGKVQNEDIATLKNTILKMAKKRAKIDATLAATRSSGIFTQDMDDISHPQDFDEPHVSARRSEEPPIAPKRIVQGIITDIAQVKNETLYKLQDGDDEHVCTTTNPDYVKRLAGAHGLHVEFAYLESGGRVKVINTIEHVSNPDDLVPVLEASIAQVEAKRKAAIAYDDAKGLAYGTVKGLRQPAGKGPMKVDVQCGDEILSFATFSKTSQNRLNEYAVEGAQIELAYKMGQPFKGKAQRDIKEVISCGKRNFHAEENEALGIDEEPQPF
jgi:hypothetical protein